MAGLARLKTWISDETLTAADLNAEFDNLIDTIEASDFTWTGTHTLSTGLVVGSTVRSDIDSTDDLGTTTYRWANVYTDSIGDSGQTLDCGAATLSFDAAATIDTSGNNDLTLNAGTGDVVITASDILPTTADALSLGSLSKPLNDVFLGDGSVLYFTSNNFIKYDSAGVGHWTWGQGPTSAQWLLQGPSPPTSNEPDGVFHIHAASAGTVTANTSYDTLVLEESGSAGISILPAVNTSAGIVFGDGTDNNVGSIIYSAAASPETLTLSTSVSDARIDLKPGTGGTIMCMVQDKGVLINGNASEPSGSPAGILALFNGTLGTSTDGCVQMTSTDIDASNTTLAIQTQGTSVYAAGTPATATGAIRIVVNGTTYYLAASTSAPT